MHYSHPFAAIERNSNCLRKDGFTWLSLLLIILAIASAALTLFGIYQLAWTGPFRDIWEFVGDIRAQLQGHWSWTYLIDAYGGAHRIFLPKVIFWADYRFFNGSNILTISLSLFCQCLSLWLCSRFLRESTQPYWLTNCLLAGFIAAFFHAGQLFNFLYAMDVQWFMANTFALIAMMLCAKTQSWAKVWAALCFAILASLCNFTGLMAVLLIAVAGFIYSRAQPYSIANWTFPFLIGVYVFWYVKTGKSNDNLILSGFLNSESIEQFIFHTIHTLISIVPFTLKMLSNPLSREWPITGSLLALGSLVFLTLQSWQLRSNPSRCRQIVVMWCWYIVLGCAFTALGRILYPNSATAERYLTLTLPYTILIISLIWLQGRSNKTQLVAAALLVPFAIYFYGSTSIDSLEKMSLTSQQQHIAQAAARSDVLDLNSVRGSLSFPMINQGHNAVAQFNAWLATEKLGYTRNPPQITLLSRWDTLPYQNLPSCQFVLHHNQLLPDNHMALEGEMHSSELAPLHLLFGDGENVVGFGYNSTVVGAWLPWRENPTSHRRFTGFINHLATAKNGPSSKWQAIGFDRYGKALCQSTFPPIVFANK